MDAFEFTNVINHHIGNFFIHYIDMLNFILQVDKLLHLFNLQSEISLHDMQLLPLLFICINLLFCLSCQNKIKKKNFYFVSLKNKS